MEKKVSLKNIADKTGVNTTKVPQVLDNKLPNSIKPEVAQNIRNTVAESNDSPKSISRNPKNKKTNTIGLVVADISNPFSSSLARIIEEEADKAGYTVLYGSSDENPEKLRKLIRTFREKKVDGLIIVPSAGTESQIKELENSGIPFVLLDRYFPEIATSYVALNNFQASYMAVNHLVDHGHKRIGMITLDMPLFHMQERRRGFVKGLSEHNMDAEGSIIELSDKFLPADMERAFDELLKRENPVDALYLTTNRLGMFGLKYINNRKIKVPQQLAVISFDETEFLDLFSTPVTQLRQPLEEMGYQAAHILIDSIANNHKITQLNLQPLLVIKGSSTMTAIVESVMDTGLKSLPAEPSKAGVAPLKRNVKRSGNKKKLKMRLGDDILAPAI